MLRWMAPFLSFTAEEAWHVLGMGQTIFNDSYVHLPEPDMPLLGKWARILKLREEVNKEIELVRSQGLVGSSLQAEVDLTLAKDDLQLLQSLGEDVRFVFITSALRLHTGDALGIKVSPSAHTKCERCWHYREDVGHDSVHATLCGRCTGNLFGAGESRLVA
jgi:isoleucyl-tRNA synthetase